MVRVRAHKIGGGFLLRLDKGEEVHTCLSEFCFREKIGFASVSGIGAASEARLAVFDTKTKKYAEREFEGDLEIVSLSGNITMAGGKPKPHIHACIADHSLKAQGGHLFSAKISVTCEIALMVSDVAITRKKDETTGLMLIG